MNAGDSSFELNSTQPIPVHTPIASLAAYLECSRDKYAACIDHIDTDLTVDGVQVTLRFHHLRFDSNGEPKFQDLANCLADHLVEYCFAARRRGEPKQPNEYGKLHREARGLLRKYITSGESGELLLYFLLESVLGAPQIVAKMDLKTNRKLEGFGSDGIHMSWNIQDNCLDLFFGEAKLEKNVGSALDHAFESIEKFHAEGSMELEFGLVTSHFKWTDDKVRTAVIDYVDRQKPGGDCRINHACLIGYDWAEYKSLGGLRLKALEEEFKRRYLIHATHLRNMLADRFEAFTRKKLRFEVFFVPFTTVQDFRNAFIKAVT